MKDGYADPVSAFTAIPAFPILRTGFHFFSIYFFHWILNRTCYRNTVQLATFLYLEFNYAESSVTIVTEFRLFTRMNRPDKVGGGNRTIAPVRIDSVENKFCFLSTSHICKTQQEKASREKKGRFHKQKKASAGWGCFIKVARIFLTCSEIPFFAGRKQCLCQTHT